MMKRRGFSAALAAVLLGAATPLVAQQPKAIRVAVAADMRFAIEPLRAEFTKQSGVSVSVTSGVTAGLVRQIMQGAPFDVLLSADEQAVFMLAREGFAANGTKDQGAVYAFGHIALAWPKAAPAMPARERILAAKRIAIANPEHAPYGRAAVGVLQRMGIYEQVKSRLILGENVAQAAQFVASGTVDLGLVALSIAKAPEVASKIAFEDLSTTAASAEQSGKLTQRMLVLKSAKPGATEFFDFMQTVKAKEIMASYGLASR